MIYMIHRISKLNSKKILRRTLDFGLDLEIEKKINEENEVIYSLFFSILNPLKNDKYTCEVNIIE